MSFKGSSPQTTPNGTKAKILNKIDTWVILPNTTPAAIKPHQFYINFANQVIQQNIFGTKTVIPPPYIIEQLGICKSFAQDGTVSIVASK